LKSYFAYCLNGCETWSIILTEEHKLRVFEKWVLRKIFGLRGRKQKRTGKNCTISFNIGNYRQILLGRSNKEG